MLLDRATTAFAPQICAHPEQAISLSNHAVICRSCDLTVTRDPSSRTVRGSSIVNYHADARLPGLGYDAAGNLLGMPQSSFDASSSGTSSTTHYQYQHLNARWV